MIVTLILFCVFIILLYYCIIYRSRKRQLINLIPGPIVFPLFGNIPQFSFYSLEDLWIFIHKMSDKYYPIYRCWSFKMAYVNIRHPDDMEIILNNTKHIEKGYIYNFLHPWLKTGLLTSDGAKWQKRRKILTPAFHFHILKQFTEIMIEESEHITKSLKDMKMSIIEDLFSFTSEHTLNVICRTAMGTSLKDMGQFQKQYRYAVREMSKIITYRLMRPWLYTNAIFALTSMGRKQNEVLKILHQFTDNIIAERKSYHQRTGGKYLKCFEDNILTKINDVEVTEVRKKRLAMLDLLIAASDNNRLSDLDIREEVDTFMFEGHDTVSIAMSFALLLLAEHKNIQDRVRDEVSAVMEENGGKLTMTALQNLPYLERCLKESMRLYPSVPIISRVSAEDIKLQNRYVVPHGTTLILYIFALHRDPNFWENPDVFNPDRFLPEKMQNRHPYSYLPFSAGPRNCIGQRFALMELKAAVASIVHNFYLVPVDYLKDARFTTDLVFRVVDPLRIKFVPVERTQESSKTKIDLI